MSLKTWNLPFIGLNTLWEKEKMLVTSIFFLSTQSFMWKVILQYTSWSNILPYDKMMDWSKLKAIITDERDWKVDIFL